MSNWRTNWEQDEQLLIKESRKDTNIRYCKRCKRKTKVVEKNILSEYCFECGKNYDDEDFKLQRNKK